MGQTWTFRKYKLGRVVDGLEDRGAIEANFSRLYKNAIRNLMKTSTMAWNRRAKSPGTSTCWGQTSCKTALQKRTWGSWWTTHRAWIRNVPVAKAACGKLGCSSKGVTSKLRRVFPFCSAHPSGCHADLWAPQYKKDTGRMESLYQRATRMVRGTAPWIQRRGQENWAGSAWRKNRDIAAVSKSLLRLER